MASWNRRRDGRIRLAPGYDLLATQILLPADREESAPSIEGRKAKLEERDFKSLAEYFRLTPKQTENVFSAIRKSLPEMEDALERSFALGGHEELLSQLIREHGERLEIL